MNKSQIRYYMAYVDEKLETECYCGELIDNDEYLCEKCRNYYN